MAVDKNSKAYQWLLDSGYTDAEIMEMHDALAAWQTPSEIMGKNNTSTVYDPMADLTPEYLENMDYGKDIRWANQSFSQYWDDSSPEYQNKSRWWLNDKYSWEWVKNDQLNYDANLMLKDLNPNFVYWLASKVYGTDHPWYITQRNDQIASALYNEWKTSKDDVAYFLWQQKWWMNSSEADRGNTIEAIYKRLGAIAEQNPKEEEKPDLSKADNLVQDTSGKIYWKTTAEEWEPSKWIDTLADANSVFKAMEESRVANLKSFISMNPSDIAELMVSWTSPFSDQTLRDAQQYYPEFMAQVNAEKKKKIWQQNVNAMTSGNYDYVTSDMEAKKGNIDSSKDAMAKEYSNSTIESDSTRKDIENAVATNQTAIEANDNMEKLEKEAAELKNRLKNLREEANSKFKWDVPDYLVNAYINNRTQEIQNQLSIIEDRYNAAYNRYTTQLDQEWKQKQYNLQIRQQKLQEDKFEYEKQQTNAKNNVIEKDWVFYNVEYTDDWVVISQVQVKQEYAWSWMKWKWLKNNNPWNIKDNDFWNVLWHDNSWFAIFATPEDWFDALVEKIKYNQTNPNSRYYWTTIREYFRIYAPSSDWNNPDAYAQSVAKQLWVSVDTPISQLDPTKFAAVIAKHDSWYDYSTYWQFRTWSTQTSNVDLSGIEVPDDVYIQNDGYMEWRVDPNSEEWKKLAQQYRIKKAKEMGYMDETWWDLIADADWKNTAAYRIISSDWETPLVFRQRLYNLVPTQLKNSDKELQNLYDIAKDIYKAWYSADEASMIFYWVDPREDKTWMLKNLIYRSRMWEKLWDSYYWDLWWLVDAWMLDEAVAKVETSVLPSKYVEKETKAISIIKKIDRLRDKLKEADDVVWPFEWSIEKFKNKYVDWWWAYQQVASDIVQIYSDIRRDLMGSAVTDTELKVNEDMFPSMNDKMKSIKVKIQSLENSLIDDLNWYRDVYKLPELTKKSLLNQSLRKYHYWYGWWTDNNWTNNSWWTDLS